MEKAIPRKEVLELAAQILNSDADDVLQHCSERDDGIWYFWEPVKGGVAVLVNDDLEFLTAASCVNPDVHLREFLNGRRN